MVEKDTGRKLGRPRKFDQDEVLDQVIDVFWELGYEAADTQTLSERTGLSKPSLYNAFGAKEDLFIAALGRYQETRTRTSIDALLGADTPEAGIEAFFLNFAENVAGEGHPSGCLMLSIAVPLRERLPKVEQALNALPMETYSQVKAYFEKQIREGHLDEGFDADLAMELMGDFNAAMSVQARAGEGLASLSKKAVRNAKLVMLAGNGGLAGAEA